MVWYTTMAFPSQQASWSRATSAECGGIEERLETMELVGKVETLERMTYKERLNVTAVGREAY